jgi:hypothetical protein
VGAEAIASLLPGHRNINTLDLWSNKIGSKGAVAIAKVRSLFIYFACLFISFTFHQVFLLSFWINFISF